MRKILIVIPSFNVEKYISGLFDALPWQEISIFNAELYFLIINDCSNDKTSQVSELIQQRNFHHKILVLNLKNNIGYGGVQKIGFVFANKYNFDSVTLLHGDGQYDPKMILEIARPVTFNGYDLVLGTRMKPKLNALKGGMPVYKWIGNIVLTKFQNILLGSKLSEFHTGYRSFSKKLISNLPFTSNSNYYDFDTQLIIQALETKMSILEVPIPTIYRGEISHLNGILYSFKVVRATIINSKIYLKFFTKKIRFNIVVDNQLFTNLVDEAILHSNKLTRKIISEM